MTVAVDIKTGAVVGQVIRDFGINAAAPLRLLTKDGVIRDVPRASVRLEKV